MAKRSVLDHPKFTELQETLQQPKGAVLGWLECLWHFTAKFTPQGNVGKYTDKQIERWLEWNGDPGGLIKALVSCGWIDISEHHRLTIHDWHDHCDDSVKKTLKRNGLECVSGHVQTKLGQITDKSRLPEPSLAMPSHAGAASDDASPPRPASPFEKPPKLLANINPIARYPEPVQIASRDALDHWHFWAHGCLANVHNETTSKDLNRLAAAEESQPGTLVKRIKEFVAKPPPGWPRDSPLFKVLKHLGYDAPLASSPKAPHPPRQLLKDYTAERLAKEKGVA